LNNPWFSEWFDVPTFDGTRGPKLLLASSKGEREPSVLSSAPHLWIQAWLKVWKFPLMVEPCSLSTGAAHETTRRPTMPLSAWSGVDASVVALTSA
jgi:hypothetical protein